MKKIIPLIITGILLAGNLFAQKLNAKITDSVNVTCMGDSNGSAAVQGIGGYPPYTYLWEPGGQTTDTATGLAAGTYTATVTDTASDTAEAIATIGTAAPPIVVATSSSEPSCFGMNNGAVAVTSITGGTAPFLIEWLPIMNNNDTVTGLPASTYTAQVTDANGCQVQNPVPVSQPPPLQLTAAAIGNFIQAYTTGGTLPYTYAWYPNVSTTSLATGLSAGTYTVTVHDSNKCSDSMAVTVNGPELYFTLGDTSLTCGDPGYFSFDVLISSDSAKRLNDCTVFLQFPPGEFAGDNFYDGSIYPQLGPDFQYNPPDNDYQISGAEIGDSVIQLEVGNPPDSSPLGTMVDTIPQVLLHIRLKITNSCATGAISFYTGGPFYFSHYVYEDSVYSHLDSTKVSYTLCCRYQCGDSLVPPYLCNEYCCQLDIWGNCIDSCWDTCNTVPIWCYDTIWTYTYDSSYVYYNYANLEYISTSYSAGIPTSACGLSITSFNSPINAGTNAKSVSPDPADIPANSSIFIIKGWGFGSQKGTVLVSNADNGFNGKGREDMIPVDSSDILIWSENLIKIKMSSLIGDSGFSAGSGPFTVISACGQVAPSPQPLQINYSILNVALNTGEKIRPDIVMAQDSESFKFMCDTSVWYNPKALACVKKALQTWNCYTGVNWKLVGDTTGDTTKQDGVSVIYFTNNFSRQDTSAVMKTSRWWYLPCGDAHDSVTFKDESDTKIRKQPPYGLAWSYDITGIGYSPDSVYFYDDILHELGHAHGVGHINDTLSLMYWNTAANFRPSIISQGPYYPGPGTLLGAMDMIYTSVSSANIPALMSGHCPYYQLDTSRRFCFDPTLSVPAIPENPFNLVLFPNPINSGNLTIAYQLTEKSYIQFKILDCTGRAIMNLNNENKPPGNYSEQVNIAALAGGVYLFTATINGECKTIKFIKL